MRKINGFNDTEKIKGFEDAKGNDITSLKVNFVDESTIPYVKVKEMVPGELYYDFRRSLYLYLGRDDCNNFCWYFVSNIDVLMRNDFDEYKSSIERTKSNKKVRRFADASKDPKVYMSEGALELLRLNWKADLTGFSLQ